MGLITRPYSYSPNTLIESAKANSNETTIFNEFNGSITDANVSSLSESKITFSATGHAHSGGTGGAPVQLVVGTNIASAGSITIPTDGNVFSLTGNTGPITSLGTRNAGVIAYLVCASTPTFTYNATSLILFGAANYTATALDILGFMSLGSGNWRQISGPNGITAGSGVTLTRSANSVSVAAASTPASGYYAQVAGITTTSTSYVDATSHTITITTSGGKVLLALDGNEENSGGSTDAYTFAVDAVDQDATAFLFVAGAAATRRTIALHQLVSGLSAGSHTFKVRWKVGANTGSLNASQFSAVEVL